MLQALRQRLVAVKPERLAGICILFTAAWLAASLCWTGLAARLTGSADSANTLVVARNLVERGRYEVDYVAYYFYPWASVTHPEDSFPLAHPTLVALFSLPFGDVFVGANLYGSLIAFGIIGLIPWLILHRAGLVPGVMSFLVTLSFESRLTTLGSFTNDGAAAFFAGLALVIFLLDSLEGASRSSLRKWALGLLLGIGILHKTSAAFVLVALVALTLLDNRLVLRDRLIHAFALAAPCAVMHVPVVLWTYRHLGELGTPRNAPGREFVRSIAHDSDYLTLWERYRTYWPAGTHPIVPTGIRGLIGRIARSVQLGWPLLLPLPWACAIVLALRSPQRRLIAFAAVVVLTSLLLPAYSHHEARYFFALRPALALVLGLLVGQAVEELKFPTRALHLALAIHMLVVAVPLPAFHREAMGVSFALATLCCAVVLLRTRNKPALTARLSRVFAVVAIPCSTMLTVGSVYHKFHGRLGPRPDSTAALAKVVQTELPRDAIVMTRRPWNLTLLTRLRSVMIPYDAEHVCLAANRFGASVLAVHQNDESRLAGVQAAISTLPVLYQDDAITLYQLACDGQLRAEGSM